MATLEEQELGANLAGWIPTIFLDPKSRHPVFVQIAQALQAEIERGRLRPGDALPGYRTLAEQLGISRNTVMAAYRELQDQGWLVSTPGEGSKVAPAPPTRAQAAAPVAEMGFDLGTPARPEDPPAPGHLLRVGSGIPDPRLLPGAALARAYRRALTLNKQSALTMEDAQGHPKLREALAAMLSATRGIAATPERILVTRGSQMAYFLAAHALVAPGDAVVVEALGHRNAWEAFARAGARCLPVAVDRDGLDVDAVEALLTQHRVRAVLVSPQRHYPTLVTLSPERRERLLSLASRHRLALLENDQDSEFQYEGHPLAPLAAADATGVVVHVGTLSKVFTPGLRLGLVHGPVPLIARMKELRLVFDRQGDLVLERAMAELMEDGELARHLNKMQLVYRRRRDVLVAALRRELGEAIQVEPPSGGLALWVEVADGIDADRLAAKALELGVAVQPGRQFSFEGRAVPGLRIGFSNYPEPELEEVARRLGAALRSLADPTDPIRE